MFTLGRIIASVAGVGLAAGALACDPITFENLATGTVVTTQYPGVTFSANAQTCPAITNCLIVTPPGGTSSGTKGIALATGCPDFSPEGIRMVFANLQADIQFNIGMASAGTINVKAYNNAGGLAFNQNFTVAGSGVNQVVHITTLGGVKSLRRVEVANTIGDFEYLDDLVYDVDTTAPIVDITGVPDFQCICAGGTVLGSVTEPDSTATWGMSVSSRLGDPGSVVYVQFAGGVVPAGGAVSGALSPSFTPDEGYYYLKIDAVNRCGLRSSDQRLVYVNRVSSNADVRSPLEGDVVGGTVCFDGTAGAVCGVTYSVKYELNPGVSTAVAPVDPEFPLYTTPVTNDTLAMWDTRTGPTAVPDGAQRVIVQMTKACGFSGSFPRNLVVDNTPPTAVLVSPLSCNHVNGLVSVVGIVNDAHLGGWALDYTGGDATGWVRISQGTAPMFYNVLGMWNTTGLRQCAYTLRLTAWDTASVNCGAGNNTTERLVSVDLGCEADFNHTGALEVADIFAFLNAWFAGCP